MYHLQPIATKLRYTTADPVNILNMQATTMQPSKSAVMVCDPWLQRCSKPTHALHAANNITTSSDLQPSRSQQSTAVAHQSSANYRIVGLPKSIWQDMPIMAT